jgi:hypothetical protein
MRIGSPMRHRRLTFWGLVGLDRVRAKSTADDEMDRLLMVHAVRQ